MEEIPVGSAEYNSVMQMTSDHPWGQANGVKVELRGNQIWGKIRNEPWKLVGEIETEYTTPRDYFKAEVADQIAPASQMFWRHYWNRKVNPDYKIKPSRASPHPVIRDNLYE